MVLTSTHQNGASQSKRKMKSTLICVYFAFFVGNCLAALYTFNNSAGGSWNTAVNWSPEGIPGSADDGELSNLFKILYLTLEQSCSPTLTA